jgi:hypothetical protein
MQRIVWWMILVAGAGVFGLIAWNAMHRAEPPVVVQPAPRSEPPPAPPPPAEPEIRHPVPGMTSVKPLPALDTSDSTMQGEIPGLSADQSLVKALILQGFVRRVVATIDSLTGPKVASRIQPVQRVPGAFVINGNNEHATIAPDNADRYTNYVRLLEAIASDKLAAFYFHYYPLFQQAYRDLGYPKGHFNDRLVEVIDHLLAAPELKSPVALVRPKVFYLYADPELEAKSAGQKILMRMGAENAGRVKAKLREIQSEITKKPAATAKGK